MTRVRFRRRVVPVARRRRGPTPPPIRIPGRTRVLGVISSRTSMRRATVTSARSAKRGIRMGCMPIRMGRRRPSRRRVFRMMRGTPRFPNNVPTYLRFLCGGVGCPPVTRRGNARKRIILRFIIRHSNDVNSVGIMGDISPCLSGRTLHIIGAVPG